MQLQKIFYRGIVLAKRIVLFVGISFLLVGTISCNKPTKKHRLIHNNDGTDALGNYWFHRLPLCAADINAYVDTVANSQVTTFMMCSGSDFFYYRSKYGRLFCDDLNGTLNCGTDTANYRYLKKFHTNFLNLEKEGTDLISASLIRAKQDGMEAFITYRMNDLHFNDTTTHCPLVYTDFWYGHPEFWVNDDTPGWNASRALDFAHQEVRDRKLAIISEQLEKYDMIDGFDLDFMRFIVFFKKGEGQRNAPLMTQLVKDVRAKVDEVSVRRGKKILLSVRVPPTIEACLDKGLDIQEWVHQGLVDFVSIGVHWRGDPSLPVDKFKNDLGKTDIPVYASIDDGGYRPREAFSHGMFRGMASHILSQGADGIYLFNQYYGQYMSEYDSQLHLEDEGQVCRVMMPCLLHELGSLETLKYRNKIYCLNDAEWEYGMVNHPQLPLTVSENITTSVKMYIGDNPKETIPEEAILFFRLNKASKCDIFINGKPLTEEKSAYVQLYDRARGLVDQDQEYAFIIPVDYLNQGYNEVRFQGSEPSVSFQVKRLELALKYGDVKTHGYF